MWTPTGASADCPERSAALAAPGSRFDYSAAMRSAVTSAAHAPTLSMVQVPVCGGAIVTLSMAIRHGFGPWLQPSLLIGMAQSGCTYAVIYGVIDRNVAADKRSWAMGVAAAAGPFGQFLMVPVERWLIGSCF